MGDSPSLQSPLRRIQHSLSAVDARRADGGMWTIAGLYHQLALGLLRAVEEWLAGGERTLNVEHVSDHALAGDGDEPMVVAQVKRTASSRAVHEALEDLGRIDAHVRTQHADLHAEMRYELSFRVGDLDAARAWLADWCAQEPERAGLIERIDVTCEPDPEAELVTLLANELGATAPRAVVHRWLGQLARAIGAAADVDAAREAVAAVAVSIADQLADLHAARRRLPFVLWSAGDRAPDEVTGGYVLTGQQPLLHNLSEGAFAPRPAQLRRVLERFQAWVEEPGEERRRHGRIPVFWIGGRSGAGKSVLLLQALAALHEAGWDTLLWLSNVPGKLPDAIAWLMNDARPAPRPLIVLDDPYAPNVDGEHSVYWQEALAALEASRQRGDAELPTFVCCGPLEQAALLARDFDDQLDVTIETIEATPSDLPSLRAWFVERTGHAPPEAEAPDNALLVQLLFEWERRESLGQFAERFRQRLRAADASGALELHITRLLAANRLYVGYPPDAAAHELTPAQLDALERLRDEEHIREEDALGRTGSWFAHPHLADVIYSAWRPPTERHQRADDFRAVAVCCLSHGRTLSEQIAPLRVLGLARGGMPVAGAERLDDAFAETLPEVWRTAREQAGGAPPLEQLATWVRLRIGGAVLDPDPVDDALTLLAAPVGLRGIDWTARSLLSGWDELAPGQRERLASTVVSLLRTLPEWQDWPRVADLAIGRVDEQELRPLLDAWLGEHVALGGAGWTVRSALLAWPDDELFRCHAERLLDHDQHAGWGYVWTGLWEVGPDDAVAERGLTRLREHPDDGSWSHIWERLYERGGRAAQLVPLALAWLPEHRRHSGWAHVWTRLHDEAARLGELLPRGALPDPRAWLAANAGEIGGFGHVWQRFAADEGLDGELRALGVAHLRSIATPDSSWGAVLPPLARVPIEPDLARCAQRWLDEATDDVQTWGYVPPALVEVVVVGVGDPHALARRVRECLRGWLLRDTGEHLGWSHAFSSLWRYAERSEPALSDDLRDRGVRWLACVTPTHHAWGSVWQTLWQHADGGARAELLQRAGVWLRDPTTERHRSWGFVFSTAVDAGMDVEDLVPAARRWLAATSHDVSAYPYVLMALNAIGRTECAHALGWLDGEMARSPVGDLVWKELWKALPEDDAGTRARFAELGYGWLAACDGHEQWPSLWQRLAIDDPDRARHVGTAWLKAAGAGHPHRTLVAARLEGGFDAAALARSDAWHAQARTLRMRLRAGAADESTLRETLEALAAGAPARERSGQVAWSRLWQALWNVMPSPEARALALAWLASPDAAGRGRVLVELARDGVDAQLRDRMLAYLRSASEASGQWPPVWQLAWRCGPDSELYELGRRWALDAYPEALSRNGRAWPDLWNAVWRYRGERTLEQQHELERVGLRALHEHAASAPLGDVWLAFWEAACTPPDRSLQREVLRALAQPLLATHGWRWQAVAEALAARPRPAGAAEHPPHPAVTQAGAHDGRPPSPPAPRR